MSVCKVLTVPNPVLRQKAQEVHLSNKPDKRLLKLIKDLEDTLEVQTEPRGVGLSAPQINVLKRILVLKIEKKVIPFLNPQIIFFSRKTLIQTLKKEEQFLEGCLSVPGYWGFVNRPAKIKVRFQDERGQTKDDEFEGRQAAFFQHEYDHLDGILFLDRILAQKGKLYRLVKNKEGKDTFVEVKLT